MRADDAIDGGLVRRTNLPNVPRWLDAVERDELPPARIEQVAPDVARSERVMLALRLDEPLKIAAADLLEGVVDPAGLERVSELELGTVRPLADADGTCRGDMELRLTRRGRMLQGSVGSLLLDPEG
jgi:coproporphyrinogen III oxidase-like Fe-S oxidoreductase